MNVNKPSASTEVEGKGLNLWSDITVQKKQVNLSSEYILFLASGQYGPFSLKNDALPLNSLFWSPPTAVHRFDAWDMAVPGLYISWVSCAVCSMQLIQGIFIQSYDI